MIKMNQNLGHGESAERGKEKIENDHEVANDLTWSHEKDVAASFERTVAGSQ